MGNFLDKLNKLKQTLKVNQGELAVKLGVTKSYLSQVFHGREPGRQLQATVEALLEQVNKPRQPLPPPPAPAQDLTMVPLGHRKVPVVSWVTAGKGLNYEDLCTQIQDWVWTDSKDANGFGVIVEGDSMEPRICAGDILVVEPNSLPRNGDVIVAILTNGDKVCKRYYRTGKEGQMVKLVSDNPAYAPRELQITDFEKIYVVFEFKGRIRR